MTQVTPPGWYPDPGQTSDAPPTERWWDGKAWTDRTRPVGSAAVWGSPPQPSPTGADENQDGAPGPDRAQDEAAGWDKGPDQPPAHHHGQDFGPAQQPYPAYPAYPGGPAGPVHGGYPAYPGQQPAGGRRGMRTGIAVGVAAAVLACIGVGVFALTDDGGDGRAGSRQGPGGQGGPEGGTPGDPFGGPGGGQGGSGGPDGGTPSPGQSEQPDVEGGGTVSDAINGISLPVPQKWTGKAFDYGAQVTSESTYKCPGDTSKNCTTGGAYSAPAVALGADGGTAEEVARADIAANAKESYGGSTYGSITSHKVLASEAVTVAGQKGYLVRWKAVTSKGADGIVESLAFPSPSSPKQIVVVRFGIDAGENESVIDEITEGIKVSSGGGSGQDV
jgi:Protein of unknown function (DUF2510)